MSQENEQNKRLRSVEQRLSMLEVQFAELLGEIKSIRALTKVIISIAGLALGIEVQGMVA